MSIIVSVKIHGGIVLAADSATTFLQNSGTSPPPATIYENENKIVNLIRGLPVGVMTCGAGSVGNASISTLLKDFRLVLSKEKSASNEFGIDRENYTIESISEKALKYFQILSKDSSINGPLRLRICGYSSGKSFPEVWDVLLNGPQNMFERVQGEMDVGPRWEGELEALDRVILGVASLNSDGAAALGVSLDAFNQYRLKLMAQVRENLIYDAAPIQEAIDLARFMVETTKGFVRFSIKRHKTVGGVTEVATITKHEGFKWVHRKLFFPSNLNA